MTYKEKIAVRRLEIKKQLESNKKNWQDILDKRRTERDSIASYVVPVIEENHKDWGLRYADDLKRMIADKGCDPTKQELLRFRSFFTDRAVHSEAIQYSVRALIGEKRNVSAAGTKESFRKLLKQHDVIIRVFTIKQPSKDNKAVFNVADTFVVIDNCAFFPISFFGKMKKGFDADGNAVSIDNAAGTKVPCLKECRDFAKELHEQHEVLVAATWDILIKPEEGQILISDVATSPKLSHALDKRDQYWSLLKDAIDHYNKRQHKNRLVVRSVKVDDQDKTTVRYEYDVIGPWNKWVMPEEEFSVSYSEEIDEVPESILVLPLLANFLPLAWLRNASIELPECDADFYDSIPEFKEGYSKMFPEASFRGIVTAGDLVRNVKKPNGKTALMFSGGVDAFATLIRHADAKPELFMIFGADVGTRRNNTIRVMRSLLNQTAEDFGLREMWCSSTMRNVFRRMLLDHMVRKLGDTWWHGFQHGIGMLSHIAPMAWNHGIDTVLIASSFTENDTYTCASDPTIDNYVRFCGTNVVHDGYELTRIMKIDAINKYKKEKGYPAFVRVCINPRIGEGKNCCTCEKCIRTILDMYACGYDPKEFGFNNYKNMAEISERFAPLGMKLYRKTRARLIPIKNKMHETYRREDVDSNLLWLYDLDLESMTDDDIKEYFRKMTEAYGVEIS